MKCVSQCNNAILRSFYQYGHKVGKHPIPFMIACIVICGSLAAGLTRLDQMSDMETLYTPENSQAFRNREELESVFPDLTDTQYDRFGLPIQIPEAYILFRSRHGKNILNSNTLTGIKNLLDQVKNITVTKNGYVYRLEDLCAKRNNGCVLSGDLVFSQKFRTLLDAGKMTYPVSSAFPENDLAVTIGRPDITGAGSNQAVLHGAGSLFLTYPLRTYYWQTDVITKDWELKFQDFMKEFVANNTLDVDIAYSSSESLGSELDKSTSGDIVFVAMTFVLMITYASIVSAGGNMVSTRAFLSSGGVLATCFGIAASFGLASFCGVPYVNMVGIMPFLLLGVGVDDMFLLMSAWSETTDQPELTVPQRIGTIFKKAGIGITITSMTNFLSFAIGSTSVFKSVRYFCLYTVGLQYFSLIEGILMRTIDITGLGVIMCYLANISFFGGCLALHGKRIDSNRHTLTCRKTKSRVELEEEGRSSWYALICGGSKPEKSMEDQSLCERGPSYALPRFLLWNPVRITVIILFVANLAVSIWGCFILKQGLDLQDLVLKTSYAHRYQTWQTEDFGMKLPISFVKTGDLDYKDPNTLSEMNNLIQKAKNDSFISKHNIDVCWLKTLSKTPFYNTTSDAAFIGGLEHFLATAPRFNNDVVIQNKKIIASRCYVYSIKLTDSSDQSNLMVRMRDLAEESPVADYSFNFMYIFFEQFIMILPTTLQTVGITIAVMCVVTAVFLPHPLIVAIVMMQVLMIVTCIFGYMAFWDLTLSSITMVHLIMSAGLSVDFCAHVCTAYMVSEKESREGRARDAIVHASGPILNGGTSSLVGILGLLFSESFIFQSFFKVMFLVIGFGAAHAVFFVPVLLSFMGPGNYVQSVDGDEDHATSNGCPKVNSDAESSAKEEMKDNYGSINENVSNLDIPVLQRTEIELNNLENSRKEAQYVNTAFVNDASNSEDDTCKDKFITVIYVSNNQHENESTSNPQRKDDLTGKADDAQQNIGQDYGNGTSINDSKHTISQSDKRTSNTQIGASNLSTDDNVPPISGSENRE